MSNEPSETEAPEIPVEFPEPITTRVVQLQAYWDADRRESPAYATGFLVEHDGKRYLVSNYHVFTGQSPDRRFNGAHPKVPAVIEVWWWGVPLADIFVGTDYVVHPNLRTLLCDIAAFPLDKSREPIKGESRFSGTFRLYNRRCASLTQIEPIDAIASSHDGPTRHIFVQDKFLSVSSDTTIFGFPAGIDFDGYAVGINTKLASQFYCDSPYFLISGTAYSGCSGAPVVARSFGGYQALTPPDIDRVKGVVGRTASRHYTHAYQDLKVPIIDQLVGIYSGRMLGPVEKGAEERGWGFVCQVWRWSLVIETIRNGIPDAEVV